MPNQKTRRVIRNDVRTLESLLQRMAITREGARRRRRRRGNSAVASNTVPLAATSSSAPTMQIFPGRRRGKGRSPIEGEITIRRMEVLADIVARANTTSTTGTKYLYPDTSSAASQMPWLSNLAKCFDRLRWNYLHVFWRPAVAATVSGQIAFGVDWNQSTTSLSSSGVVTALTPSRQVAIWHDTEKEKMVLPRARLQSMLWYKIGSSSDYQMGPGSLRYYVSHDANVAEKALGSLWIEYSATMQGTSSA